MAFCVAPMSDDTMSELMQHLLRTAFMQTKESLKLQKASLNCLSNILNADQVQPLTKPVIDTLGELYKKLKEVML